MIGEGKYRARGTQADLGYTSKGNEQVAVELVILEGDYEGKLITWWGYFTDATTDRTLESLKILGWPGADLFDLTGIDQNEVEIVVEEEQDEQGKYRSRVRWINKLGGGLAMKERMSEAQRRAFAAKMRPAVVAHGKANGDSGARKPAERKPAARKGSAREETPPPPDDDSIPF